MKVKFLTVRGRRSTAPEVLAGAADHRVWWRPHKGWLCTCTDDAPGLPYCQHIDAVIDLLDERVMRRTPPPIVPEPFRAPSRIR